MPKSKNTYQPNSRTAKGQIDKPWSTGSSTPKISSNAKHATSFKYSRSTEKLSFSDRHEDRGGWELQPPSDPPKWLLEQQPQSHEWTSRTKHEDKKSGAYQRITAKQKVSSGEACVDKATGRVGAKSECKRSSTVKVGNKNGYTEYYKEERVRKVDYGGAKGKAKSSSFLGY